MAEEITTTSTTTTASVLTTVQKFEANNFVFKTPMNTSPRMMTFARDPYGSDEPIAEIVHLDYSTNSSDSAPSTPTEPPALPTTNPPDSDSDSDPPEPEVEKIPRKFKKKREVQKQKEPSNQSDLSNKQGSPAKKGSPAKQALAKLKKMASPGKGQTSLGQSSDQNPPGQNAGITENSPGKNAGQSSLELNLGQNSQGENAGQNSGQTFSEENLGQNSPGKNVGQNSGQTSSEKNLGHNSPTKVLGQNSPGNALGQNSPGKIVDQNLGQNSPGKVLGQNSPKTVLGQNSPGKIADQNLGQNSAGKVLGQKSGEISGQTSPEKNPVLTETSPRKSQPNLSLVPRKSSLKKPKRKVDTKGLWFNMTDQYPIENFSGRATILEQINMVVHGQKSRDVRPISRAIVLTGKPSMGKTEIARKFAFKFYVDCNGKGNVIWMDGSSKESIIEALLLLEQKELLPIARADPGSVLELNGEEKPTSKKDKGKKKSEPELELQERIAGILRNRIFQDNPTLFIYDNATTEEDIVEFIPQLAPFGHIPNVLVTSGNENNWNNARVIKVAEFEFKEAVEFLLKSFEDCQGFTKFQAEDLAKELHRFPPLMQKARKIVQRYLLSHGDSDRAILRLEKNIGLVRRLKGEAIIETKEVEQAILATDRGIYFEDDPYIREYDGELRNHQISMQVHQLEAVLTKISERIDLTILAVNQDAYVLAMLAYMMGKHSKIEAVYDTEHSDKNRIDLLRDQLTSDNEDLIKKGKVDLKLIEIAVVKAPKQTKTSTLLDKVRSLEKKSFDLIFCNLYVDQDLSSVKKLLASGGRFVTCMSSLNVSSILKKSDQKKIQIKIMKHDFPELLVIATKL